MATKAGLKASGVRTLAAQLLGFRISKGAQCSNWERGELAPAQVVYAATDAWICREIFLVFGKRHPRRGDQEFAPAAEEKP